MTRKTNEKGGFFALEIVHKERDMYSEVRKNNFYAHTHTNTHTHPHIHTAISLQMSFRNVCMLFSTYYNYYYDYHLPMS